MCAISIIIPTLNEEAHIARTLSSIHCSTSHEIIIADGGSRDETECIAKRFGATIVHSKPGRGYQLNTGARAASGNVFVFLHADTLLPPGFDEFIAHTLSQPKVVGGAFQLRIDASNASLRLVEAFVNFRSRVLAMPYGDQAIFLRADSFYHIGGFPNQSVLEDFEFIRRLCRRGRIQIARGYVSTSARRWLSRGIWRTTMLNQLCIAAYMLGIRTERIAGWRTVPRVSHKASPTRLISTPSGASIQ